MRDLRIGLMAERTGTSTATIRFYEKISLLPRARRQEGGQRRYSEEDVSRLKLIRRCREFGFSIDQIHELMAIYDDPESSCNETARISQEHLNTVRAKISELKALEKNMVDLVTRCETTCAGGSGPSCTVFDDMASGYTNKSKIKIK